MPRFIKDRDIKSYLLKFIPIYTVLSFLVLKGKQYLGDEFTQTVKWMYTPRFAILVIVSSFFLVIFVGLLRFVEDYFEIEKRQQELENKHLNSELQLLKAQVNPHFLFNTLNNLYYLAYKNSPSTPEVIAKLAQMMRYMLNESNQNRVSLEQELNYINNYISLEKLRLNNEVPIELNVHGQIEGIKIAPMILITFLENAFKHGIGNAHNHSWIKASINVENGKLIYQVENSRISDTEKTVIEKSGIGLANVQRRLQLVYPQKHLLKIEENDDSYAIFLSINL
jgi:LytS/YehU family sensor histidine kinase